MESGSLVMASESLVMVRANQPECATSSSQNSLTGGLSPSSSQNSLTGSEVAGSSQNPMPGGASCDSVDFLGSDLDCGEVANFSGNNSGAGRNIMINLTEADIPGASLAGRDPSQLHVVELKRWLKCRGAMVTGRKKDLVKR